MLPIPPTPHIPLTPRAFSFSASATTAPVHVSLHIPLLALAPAHYHPGCSTGPDRAQHRLNLVHRALSQIAHIQIELWTPTPWEGGVLAGEEMDDVRETWEGKRRAWREEEGRRWDALMGKDVWVLRGVPRGEGEEVGMPESWQGGDGVGSEEEGRAAYKEGVWTLPILLQRHGVALGRRGELGREVEGLTAAVGKLNAYVQDGVRMLRFLPGERCVPVVEFYQAASGPVVWEEQAVRNLLLLLTAFERELNVLATPYHLLTYIPLSHFLCKREIASLRWERILLWKHFREEAREDRRGGMRRQRAWRRKVESWLRGVREEDEVVQRRDELLGEEGMSWWERLDEMLSSPGAGQLVREIGRRTGGRGKRVAVGLGIDENPSSHEMSTPSDADEAEEERGAAKTQDRGHKRQDSLPAPPPPFPHISTLSFPLPLRGLAASTLLAYIDLLSNLVLLAASVSSEDLREFVQTARRDSRRARETPLEGLVKLAEKVSVGEEGVEALRKDVGRWCGEDTGNWGEGVEGMVARGYKEGRRAVGSHYSVERSSSLDVDEHGQGDGHDDLDKEEKKPEEEGEVVGNRKTLVGFLERYEFGEGFLVPGKMKVVSLLEAEEERRKVKRERKEGGDGHGNGTRQTGHSAARMDDE